MKPITRCFLWKINWKIGGRRSNSIRMEWKYAAASAAYLTHEWKQRDFEYDLPLPPSPSENIENNKWVWTFPIPPSE